MLGLICVDPVREGLVSTVFIDVNQSVQASGSAPALRAALIEWLRVSTGSYPNYKAEPISSSGTVSLEKPLLEKLKDPSPVRLVLFAWNRNRCFRNCTFDGVCLLVCQVDLPQAIRVSVVVSLFCRTLLLSFCLFVFSASSSLNHQGQLALHC